MAAPQGVVRVGDDVRRMQEEIEQTRAEHRDFARSVEAKPQAHHDAIQRLVFEAQRDRENAARDRADAARDRENLLLRLEIERLRTLLPPNPAGTPLATHLPEPSPGA